MGELSVDGKLRWGWLRIVLFEDAIQVRQQPFRLVFSLLLQCHVYEQCHFAFIKVHDLDAISESKKFDFNLLDAEVAVVDVVVGAALR